jgi:hypothetical protein
MRCLFHLYCSVHVIYNPHVWINRLRGKQNNISLIGSPCTGFLAVWKVWDLCWENIIWLSLWEPLSCFWTSETTLPQTLPSVVKPPELGYVFTIKLSHANSCRWRIPLICWYKCPVSFCVVMSKRVVFYLSGEPCFRSCLLRLGLKRLVQLKGSFYSYWEQSPMYSYNYTSWDFMLIAVFCYTFIGKVDVIESCGNCGKRSDKEEVVDQ